MASRTFYVYIMASRSRVLYIGVTNDLLRRVHEHRSRTIVGFTQRYHVTRLVYFEQTGDAVAAISRERQLKGWRRERKVALVETVNPSWLDLYDDIVGG